MRIIISCVLLLLVSQIAHASCDSFEVEPFFINRTQTCENLNEIRVSHVCESIPPPGNCWNSYKEIKVVLPEGINSTQQSQQLEPYIQSIRFKVTCSQQKEYNIRIIFDNECEIQYLLNLSEIKPISKANQLLLEDNGAFLRGDAINIDSNTETKDIKEAEKPFNPMIVVFLFFIIAMIFVAFKQKKK